MSAWVSRSAFGFNIVRGASSAAAYIPNPEKPLWSLSWWTGVFPTLVGVFILRGIDLIILGIMVIFIGSAVSYCLRKDDRFAQSIISINLAFWVRFIAIESAKIFENPEISLTLTSPLVFYTLASIATTIIAVFLTYKRYKHLPFT